MSKRDGNRENVMIGNILKYEKRIKDYTELRGQRNRKSKITLLNGDITDNEQSSQSGVSARVYKNGMWGFSSSPSPEDENIETILSTALDNASFLASREEKRGKGLPEGGVRAEKDFSTDQKRISRKDKIDFLRDVDGYIERNYSDISSRTVSLREFDMEKQLINSRGSRSYSLTPRTVLYIKLTMKKKGKPVALYETFGNLGQFEDCYEDPGETYKDIDELYEHLREKKEGVFPEPGIKPCILDADLAGILAHEAMGHTTEADMVLAGSVASQYLGEKAVSSLITLTDFANEAFGELTPVPVFVDDEGTKAEDAAILEEGVLKEYLHSKETANMFDHKARGNARAYAFNDEPLIRMRNTAITPGDSSLDDMISSIEDGYYLMSSTNGQADSTSEFMFGINFGYRIKNGKLDEAIRNTTISGIAFDVLKTVDMVSDEMKWNCAGMCGKKQPIPVGMGGPAIKCRVNVGGK